MDERGYWHDTSRQDRAEDLIRRAMAEDRGAHGNDRPRHVIECGVGETVTVVKGDEDDDGEGGIAFVRCTFEGAERNKVTLKPIEFNAHQPHLELAERVRLEKEDGSSVPAQVWDNRFGRIVLRTLPVGA